MATITAWRTRCEVTEEYASHHNQHITEQRCEFTKKYASTTGETVTLSPSGRRQGCLSSRRVHKVHIDETPSHIATGNDLAGEALTTTGTTTTTLRTETSIAIGNHSGGEAWAQTGISEIERDTLLERDRRRTAATKAACGVMPLRSPSAFIATHKSRSPSVTRSAPSAARARPHPRTPRSRLV